MPGDSSPPVKRMVFLIVVATIFAGYGTAYLASDDVRYVTRAGLEEISILQNREPIAELVADRRTDPAQLRNVAGRPEYAAIQARLARDLTRLERCKGSACNVKP